MQAIKLQPGQLPSDQKKYCPVPVQVGLTPKFVSAAPVAATSMPISSALVDEFVDVSLETTPQPCLLRDRTTERGGGDEKDKSALIRLCSAAARLPPDGPALYSPGVRFVPRFGGGGTSNRGMPDLRVTCVLATGSTLQVNSAAGKYLQMFASSTAFNVSNVGSSSEFSSFGSIFDEFFVHQVDLEYQPVNRHSANSAGNAVLAAAAGAPGFVNTIGASLVCLQHNQGAYVDAASVWYSAAVAACSKWVNLGDPWVLTWRNNERFSWAGSLGDQATTGSTQSWCNIAKSAEYGGLIQAVTPEMSGAAAGVGTLVEGGIFGHILYKYIVSFRARS